MGNSSRVHQFQPCGRRACLRAIADAAFHAYVSSNRLRWLFPPAQSQPAETQALAALPAEAGYQAAALRHSVRLCQRHLPIFRRGCCQSQSRQERRAQGRLPIRKSLRRSCFFSNGFGFQVQVGQLFVNSLAYFVSREIEEHGLVNERINRLSKLQLSGMANSPA